MLKDRIVRVNLKKRYHEQRSWSCVGRVTAKNDFWIGMEAVGLKISRQQPNGVKIVKRPSMIVNSRDNIESIIVLHDNFDWQNTKATADGQQIQIVVDGKRDVVFGGMGEG